MQFVKRWFGFDSDAPKETAEEKVDPEYARERRRVAAKAPRVAPLLQDAGPARDGGVQGLDWYSSSLLRDSDGDCADDFLEESGRQLVSESSPPHKHQRPAQLQSKAKAAGTVSAGGSRPQLAVERGHVYLEPTADPTS